MTLESEPFLFGLNHSNHDFTNPASVGKNIFTNAFPLALAQHLDRNRGLPIPLIEASNEGGVLGTRQRMYSWGDLIGTEPEDASFLFECIFDGFRPYTKLTPNKSDVVIARPDGTHTRAFEVKLVVVPNSQTASRPHDEQSCEIVVRPPSIEQIAFSIAHSYGADRRQDLLNIIVECLEEPMDFRWNDHDWMQKRIGRIYTATQEIVNGAIDSQTPFALSAVWRTVGQAPVLEKHAFDVFCWTDMAFVQLFLDKMPPPGKKRTITRPERSLVWLVSALYDYAAQSTLNFEKHHSRITYGSQTDKAGSFAGDAPYRHLRSEQLFCPRVTKDELSMIVSEKTLDHLMPERRLDGVLVTQRLLALQDQTL